jgi:hypothetical protein
MKLYRIYTENKNLDGIKDIINRNFKEYTLFYGVGVWQGIEEKSLVIEIVGESLEIAVEVTAGAIKIFNNQQAVLVTVQEIESKLV